MVAFQLPLSGSQHAVGYEPNALVVEAFNSLSRDHASAAVPSEFQRVLSFQLPLSGSLNSFHAKNNANFDCFQLPLSGSLDTMI